MPDEALPDEASSDETLPEDAALDGAGPLPRPPAGVTGWAVVVPVKGASGKSRLELPAAAGRRRGELARAIALDTLDAVFRATHVSTVIVVTSDADIVAALQGRALIVPDPGSGLNPAVSAGLAAAPSSLPRAALLGDLPALSPRDLDSALQLAAEVPLGVVPDAEGTGTTLVTARAGQRLQPAFGAASRARHEEAGLAVLDVPPASTLRRDVDTVDQLRAAAAMGLGRRTSALL
ncbi:2-phospho-L-lactate guanylyltransferase [Microbacterium marinilacus]|uniref:2-phospho-L-lactate guanylyltransferase n=1 Tax=Microbacterium marinilacus TaxID=415209 RepID=A0ABP7BL69_9MICO